MDNGIIGLVKAVCKTLEEDKELERLRKEMRELEQKIFIASLVAKIAKVIKENTPRN